MSSPDQLESRITAALERHDNVAVPADFAARVAAQLPAQRPASRRAHLGRTAAIILCALTLAALTLLAPHTAASYRNLAFDLELALVIELAAVAAFVTLNWRKV